MIAETSTGAAGAAADAGAAAAEAAAGADCAAGEAGVAAAGADAEVAAAAVGECPNIADMMFPKMLIAVSPRLSG
jgi:hypothetical protein